VGLKYAAHAERGHGEDKQIKYRDEAEAIIGGER